MSRAVGSSFALIVATRVLVLVIATLVVTGVAMEEFENGVVLFPCAWNDSDSDVDDKGVHVDRSAFGDVVLLPNYQLRAYLVRLNHVGLCASRYRSAGVHTRDGTRAPPSGLESNIDRSLRFPCAPSCWASKYPFHNEC